MKYKLRMEVRTHFEEVERLVVQIEELTFIELKILYFLLQHLLYTLFI